MFAVYTILDASNEWNDRIENVNFIADGSRIWPMFASKTSVLICP